MDKPSIGDSRKKGIAITAITAIVALKPQTYMDLSVVAGVVLIALYGMRLFAELEKPIKEKPNENKTVNIVGSPDDADRVPE